MTQAGWHAQLARYVAIGVTTNGVAYLCYIGLTSLGLWPEWAMTLVYLTSALLGFAANRRLTFSHRGSVISSGARYVLAQLTGYAVNASLLFFFVDRLRYPHALVQALAIIVVAPILFLAMKFFVFRRAAE